MSQPTRIEPLRLPDGKVIPPSPPCGGSWSLTADGALQPRDEATALAAGLGWPPAVPVAVPPAVAPATTPVAAPPAAMPAALATK